MTAKQNAEKTISRMAAENIRKTRQPAGEKAHNSLADMDEPTPAPSRNMALRLAFVAALLLLYPLGLAVLRTIPPARQGQVPTDELRITAVWAPDGPTAPQGWAGKVRVGIIVRNVVDHPVRLDQVAFTAFIDDKPAVSVVENPLLVARRMGNAREIAAHATFDLGDLTASLPRPATKGAVLVAVDCYDRTVRRKRTLTGQIDIVLP
jgi:hypothetical protein